MTATDVSPKTRKSNVGNNPAKGALVKRWQIGLYAFAIGASLVLLLANLMLIINGTFSAVFFIIALLVTGLSWGLVVNKGDEDASEPGGLRVAGGEPDFTAFVRLVADAVDAPMPDDVYLVTNAELHVHEQTEFFGLKVTSSALRVGLPFVHALTQQELAALLAHELAHYAPGDVPHGPRAIRGLQAARDLIAIERKGFLNGVYGSYARKMFRSVGGVGVAQEGAADRVAAKAFGTDALRSALSKYDDIAVAFDEMLRDYVVPALQHGLHPEDLFGGFGEVLASSKRRGGRAPDTQRRQAQARSEFELHQTPLERLATLEDGEVHDASVELANGEAPAHFLLDADARSANIAVGRWAAQLMNTSTEPRSWDDLVDEVYANRSNEIASLAFVDHEELDAGARLDRTMAWSEAEDWDIVDAAIKKPLKKVGDVDERRHAWAMCVVLDAASELDGNTWRQNWDGPAMLVDPEGKPVDADSIARDLIAGNPAAVKTIVRTA